MNNPFFDVVARTGDKSQKLGRAWLFTKDGKSSMSIDMTSMPLPSQEVHLVNTEDLEMDGQAQSYVLMTPVKREGKKTYWHRVGQIERSTAFEGCAYQVVFASLPLSGNLAAFEKGN